MLSGLSTALSTRHNNNIGVKIKSVVFSLLAGLGAHILNSAACAIAGGVSFWEYFFFSPSVGGALVSAPAFICSAALAYLFFKVKDKLRRVKTAEKEAKRLYEVIFNSNVATILIDNNFNILKANDRFLELLELNKSIVGKACNEELGLSICGAKKCPLRRITAGTESYESEGRVQLKNGEELVFICSAVGYKDTNGNMAGALINFIDITKRKKNEKALVESEKTLKAILTALPVGIGLVKEKRLVWANNAFYNLLDYDKKDLRKYRSLKYFPQKNLKKKYGRDLLSIVDEISYGQFETSIERRDGTLIECMIFTYTIDFNAPSKGRILALMDVSDLKKAEEKVKVSREMLRKLARHIEQVREEEKKYIAGEIHDELGHVFTALKIDLSLLAGRLPARPEALRKSAGDMISLIDETIPKVRSLSSSLRPSALDHFGLMAAIEWQAEEFSKRTEIDCEIETGDKEFKFSDNQSTAVFRIFQETLTNVTRHSGASKVRVKFGEINGVFKMEIMDNGVGIKEKDIENTESYGMISMRERALSLGGEINFQGQAGKGSSVILTVPNIYRED